MGFEGLLKRISPKLKGIAHKLSGRFAYFGEDDLYQEAVCRLWQVYQAGTLHDKTDSYVAQGCYFYLKNHIRKIQDKARLVSLQRLIDNEEGREAEELLPAQDINEYVDSINRDVLINDILNNGLTSREKDVFRLCVQGLTVREIGARLGISHVRVVKLTGSIKKKCQKHRDNF